jgi:hypothetical protein
VLVFSDGIRPHLLSDTIRAQGALLQVRYAFNEPVRAFLIVDGRPATATSSLRKSGALLWRRRGSRRSVQIAIEGTDRSGRRAIVRLNRVRAARSARRRVVT